VARNIVAEGAVASRDGIGLNQIIWTADARFFETIVRDRALVPRFGALTGER